MIERTEDEKEGKSKQFLCDRRRYSDKLVQALLVVVSSADCHLNYLVVPLVGWLQELTSLEVTTSSARLWAVRAEAI